MKSWRLVLSLDPGIPGDEGVIDHRSVVPIVAREQLVVAGGLAALLLQVAHPSVAAGVAKASNFQNAPLERLIGTLRAVLVITFGDRAQAREIADKVAGIHRGVHGTVKGRPYSALDPQLALWVYATLVEMALDAYSVFVRPLEEWERAEYYLKSQPFALLFRVRERDLPKSYGDFRAYYQRMVKELAPNVDDPARNIARAIFASRLRGIPVSPAGPFLAAAFLPEEMRRAYGLSWTARQQFLWRITCRLIRFVVRWTPARLRQWQHYRVALKRMAAQ